MVEVTGQLKISAPVPATSCRLASFDVMRSFSLAYLDVWLLIRFIQISPKPAAAFSASQRHKLKNAPIPHSAAAVA